jgi:hypothetical protein
MKQVRYIGARMAVVLVCAAGAAACRDSGLPGKNTPRQEARHREFRYPAYQPAADHEPIALAGHLWIGALPVESIPDRLLVAVASAGAGQTLYAQRGRTAPYGRLYARVSEGRWRPYVPLN